MKLSKSSWHYKLNRWYTYGVPCNLCGYFWRTVWYTVAFVPTLIIFIPIWIYLLFSKNKWDDATEYYPIAIMLNAGLALVICMILMWFHLPKGDHDPWQVVFIFGCVGYCMTAMLLISYFLSKITDRRKSKTKKSSLVKEYLKAKKSKYCPIIEWED